MSRISVIVPVYNTAVYLRRCVDSILCQTYPDFELILVDDGSKDDSPRICDEYAAADGRVKVIHKPNGGVSAARNSGIEAASGEFMTFVDSDDYVSDDYLSGLMEDGGLADAVFQGAELVDEGGRTLGVVTYSPMESARPDWSFRELIESGAANWTCCKRYRTGIVREHGIRFDTTISFAEDTLFTVEYLRFADRIQVTPAAGYRYVQYRSRRTLSNDIGTELLAVSGKVNRMITDIAASQEDIDGRAFFLRRMSFVYADYTSKNLSLSFFSGMERNVSLLKALAEDGDFFEMYRTCSRNGRFRIYDRRVIACMEKGDHRQAARRLMVNSMIAAVWKKVKKIVKK